VVQGPLHVGTLGPDLPGIPESLNAALTDDLRNAGLRVVTTGQTKGDLLLRIDTLERRGARAVVLRDNATLDELEAVANRLVCYSSAWGLVPRGNTECFAKDLSQENVRYFTDVVRQESLRMAPRLDVMTRENLLVLLQATGKKLEECEGDSSTRAADELFSQ
jgi:hypothetical protein